MSGDHAVQHLAPMGNGQEIEPLGYGKEMAENDARVQQRKKKFIGTANYSVYSVIEQYRRNDWYW